MDQKLLDATIAAHDGVITAAEAMACGLSRRQIFQRVADGRWQRVAFGVFFSLQHLLTDAARVRIAVAAYRGIADRATAAWWHGLLKELPSTLHLSIPRSRRGAVATPFRVDAVRRSLPAEDVQTLRGIGVTRPALTVAGAIGVVDDPARFLDQSLQSRLLTVPELKEALDRNPRMQGTAPARKLVKTLVSGAQSEAERLFVRLVRLHGITGMVRQYRFGRWRIDAAWPAEKVAVEIQGWAYHWKHSQFQNDTAKAGALTTAGWAYLPFTWHQLTGDPEDCIDMLARTLAVRRV